MIGHGSGSPSSPIMIVGEAWGEHEEAANLPFVGPSGIELNSILHDAGIMRTECFVTNLVNARPPKNKLETWIPSAKTRVTPDMVLVRGKYVHPIVAEGYAALRKEVALVRPRLILALGGSALWALTGRSGIVKWRGSLLNLDSSWGHSCPVVPTYHPAAVLRQYEWRYITVQDLRRAKRQMTAPNSPPEYKFIIRPSYDKASEVFSSLLSWADQDHLPPLWLDFDTETLFGYIRCFSLTWSETEGICIPLMKDPYNGHYWTLEQEAEITYWTYKLLTHPNVRVRGQNLLYDFQYTLHDWNFLPRLGQDTMISHHVCYAELPKSLAFQASMYSDYYWFWKDLGKESGKDGE